MPNALDLKCMSLQRSLVEYNSSDSEDENKLENQGVASICFSFKRTYLATGSDDEEQVTSPPSLQRRLTGFVVDAETEKEVHIVTVFSRRIATISLQPLQEAARQEYAAAMSAALNKALDGASATTTPISARVKNEETPAKRTRISFRVNRQH